jgi:hypothetical protein
MELLPCPFCGGENVSIFGPVGWHRQFGVSHTCMAFHGGSGDFTVGAHSRAEAIAAWNRRALPSATAWQPIETAPRDGTQFLAFDGFFMEVVRFDVNNRLITAWSGDLFSADVDVHCDATHWMPLPSPPLPTPPR